MYKYLIFLLLVFFFSGCSYKSSEIFVLEKEKNITFNQNIQVTNDSCTIDSFISNSIDKKYGKLFVEYIDLSSDCQWNAYERGYFVYEFKNHLKLQTMEVIERYDYKNYEFTNYLIDGKYYLNLIFKYSVTEATFILDYSGKLSNDLIKLFNPNYENKYLNESRFDKDYSDSLVRKNIFFSYFGKSGERDDFTTK